MKMVVLGLILGLCFLSFMGSAHSYNTWHYTSPILDDEFGQFFGEQVTGSITIHIDHPVNQYISVPENIISWSFDAGPKLPVHIDSSLPGSELGGPDNSEHSFFFRFGPDGQIVEYDMGARIRNESGIEIAEISIQERLKGYNSNKAAFLNSYISVKTLIRIPCYHL